MPSLLLPRFLLPEMSDKKSPPHKEKPFIVRAHVPDEKGMKRKLLSPGSPTNDDDDRKTPNKRKRGSVSLESSPIMGHQNISKTPGPGSRSVPLSERQQLAMIMRMADESTHGVLPVPDQDNNAKSPSPTPVQPVKKTPLDKKVHKRNERGELPIHLAAIKGDVKLLKKLIKAGADVNVADFAGWTPLHEASNRGWLYVAKQLLKAGANVNVQGLENDTPLHDASINGHRKLVELLLKHGANPLQANSKGKTPLDVASSPEMVKILKREVISSGSDCSSIEDTRSPMSQDSISSLKDEDRSLDIDEVNNTTAGSTNNRRMSMPKSPENKLASPRLCLKFQRDTFGNLNQKFKDSKEPQYKSYSVTNVSVDSSVDQMFSPVDSPASSADSDAYNPHIDGISSLTFNPVKMAIGDEDLSQGLSILEQSNNGSERNSHRELFPSQGVVNGRRPVENHQNVFNSVKENVTENNGDSVLTLKHMETKPFIPSAHWSDSQNNNLELPDLTSPLTSSSSSSLTSLPVTNSVTNSVSVGHSDNSGCNSVTSSSVLHSVSLGEGGPPLSSMVTSTTGSNNLSLVTNSVDPEPSGLSALTSVHSGSVNCYTGTTSVTTNMAESSTLTNLKWELRSASSPKLDDSPGSSGPHRSDSFHNLDSPSRPDKDSKSDNRESRPSTPKVPPLKIIIPTKSQASSSTDSNEGLKLVVTNVKSALPYVINPYQDQGREAESIPSSELLTSQSAEHSNSVDQDQPTSQGAVSDSVVTDRIKSQDHSLSDKSVDNNVDLSECSLVDSTKSQDRLNDVEEESRTDLVVDDGKSDSDSSKKGDKKDEPTQRVLRSAVRSQQTDSNKPVKQKSVDKSDKNSNADSPSITDGTITSTKPNNVEEEVEETIVFPRKRKFKTKSDLSSNQPVTVVENTNSTIPGSLVDKVPNSYDLFFKLRRKILSRRQGLTSVCPKIPQGYKDFLLNTSNYVLQGNTSSTLSVPTLSPPNSVKDKMRDMFISQEEARYKLRLQHLIEREKLILSIEQEIMREHCRAPEPWLTKEHYLVLVFIKSNVVESYVEKLILSIEQEIMREHCRAARAMANQGTPLSACTIFRDQEIYNDLNADQEEKEKKNRTRYNGRQFISWLQDVDDKYDKIKEKMILRQKQEADSLFAIQKLEWEWRLKELGQCDQNVTPEIDELHVPLVQVTDNFDLLPT